MDYVGEIPDDKFYGADAMCVEMTKFIAWYEAQKSDVFDNRNVLEAYCQDNVTVLRNSSTVFRRGFLEIGNVDVFTESVKIASACNKVLRKRFLKPNTIGIIPTGGYSCNVNQSKKAVMWLVHRERTDGCTISHGRNRRVYRLPELPNLSVDGYCHETRKVYKFYGCFWHGHTCLPFRDVTKLNKDTLSETYEQTMARLERITQAGYEVEVEWECHFDSEIIPHHRELKTSHGPTQSSQIPRRPTRGLYRGNENSLQSEGG